MNYFQSIIVGVAICGSANAAVSFHTDFDEASLGDIAGLTIDTPSTTGPDSGTVTLDTVNQTLDLTANAANMWTNREGAPIAWVAAPSVGVGVTWYAQTQITHADSPGGDATGYDQAGITFYSGIAGNNPGSENPATAPLTEAQSLFVGINDWNAYTHTIQGFADNNPHSGDNGIAANAADGTFEYRVEVTENGDSDLYDFFYREDPADAWSQIGATTGGHFDNSAVGLWLKSHNSNPTASTEFGYFEVGIVPEPSTGLLACLAGFFLIVRRRRK